MPLVYRWIAPLALAALSTVTLVATAGEWSPVHFTPKAASASSPLQARVIVKYKAGSSLVKALSATTGGAKLPQHAQTLGARLGLALVDGRGMDSRTQLVHGSGLSSAALAERLSQDADVEWAFPDRRVRARMVPNDTYFAAGQSSPYPAVGQWYLRAPDSAAAAAINASDAWDLSQGAGQVVAILDTGVRPEHPDLAGSRLLTGYNFISLNTASDGADAAGKCITGNGACRGVGAVDPGDWVSPADHTAHPTLFSNDCLIHSGNGYVENPSSWHGTQVAGIAAANTNNSLGVAGIAPAAKILPLRVLGKCGGWDSDIIDAIRWAAGLPVTGVPNNGNPARVINLSLGGSGACGAYQSAVTEATNAGAVVVVAAGNDGLEVGAPGNCNGVVTVAGVRHFGTKVGYSSLGPEVTLAAPAGNCVNTTGACLNPIVTTLNDGTEGPGNAIYSDALSNISLGTSFAAPQVSGVVALMLAAQPALNVSQVSSILRSSARSFPSSGATAGAGGGPGGAVQACQAPSLVAQDYECYCTTTTCGAGLLDANAAVIQATTVAVPTIAAVPASPAAGQAVTLDASGSSAGTGRSISRYLWEITSGGGIAAFTSATDATTATLDTTGAGSVTVRLTVTDNLGSSASVTKTLTVGSVSFNAVIAATASAGTVTLDASGSAVASGRSITGYLWEITSGGTLASFSGSTTASTATLQVSGSGNVVVRLTLTDSEGLQATASKTIPVSPASSGSGGGAWLPLWSLGLLLAALALPARARQRR